MLGSGQGVTLLLREADPRARPRFPRLLVVRHGREHATALTLAAVALSVEAAVVVVVEDAALSSERLGE